MTGSVARVAVGALMLSVACSEPLTGALGVLPASPDAQLAEDAALAEDASPDAQLDAATDSAVQAGATDGACVSFPDFGGSLGASTVAPAFVHFNINNDETCARAFPRDTGSIVYGLANQQPLLSSNRDYAFYWTVSSVLNRLTIYAGNSTCPTDMIVDLPLPQAITGFPFLVPVAGCQGFTSRVTAPYLLFAESMGGRVALMQHAFTLCEGSCPAPP